MKRKLALIVLVCLSLLCTAFVACDTEVVIHAHELEKVEALAPTCEVSGNVEYYRCKTCDKIFADEDYTSITAEETVIPATGHSYDEVIVVDPTCTEDGYTNHVCHCGDSYATDPVPATGHSYDDVVVTAPTCTEKGYTTHTCHCGDNYVDSYVDANGHDYQAVVTSPTCTEKGYTTHTCTVCDDSYVDSYVDANGHSYDNGVVTEPTCEKKGYTTHTCTVCGDSYEDNYVDAKGHNYVGAVCTICGQDEPDHKHSYTSVVTEPTCTKKGYTTHTCDCGESYVDDYVKENGHDYNKVVTEPTCTEKGYTTYTCTVCGDSYVDDYVKENGHNHKAVVTAPTCTEKGFTTYTCTACGDSHVDNYVDAKGHDYNKVVTAPTCTEKGYTTYTCTACGDSYKTDEVDKLGHSYEEDVIEPTCTEKGFTTYTCTTCGHSYTDDYVDANGHNFDEDGVCTECGAIRAKDYYIQLAQSWREVKGFSLTVENFSFEVEIRDKTTEAFELSGNIKQIDVAELTLYVEDGKLCGGAHGTATIYNGPISDADAVCEFTAVIKGDDVYIVLAYGRDKADQTYEVKLSVDYLLNYLFENTIEQAGVSAEDLSAIVSFVQDTLLPAIDTLIESDVEGVNSVLENLFNIIFTFEEQEDHTFVAKLDYEKIHALNDNLAEKSIADVIDIYFGEGSYTEVSDWLKGLLDLTIGDVVDGIDELGLKSSDLIEKVNELLADLGAEGLDLQKIIDHYSDKVIGDLLGDEYKEYFIDAIDYLKEVTLYELFGSAEDIRDAISSVIDTVSDGFSLSLVTDKEGVLQGVNLNADEFVCEFNDGRTRLSVSFDLAIELNEKLEITWSDIVDEIDSKIVLPSDDICDGNVESWYESYDSEYVYFNGEKYDVIDALEFYLNVTADSPDGILIMPDCGDWLYYSAAYVYREYKFYFYAVSDEAIIIVDAYSNQAVKVTLSENGLKVLNESGEEYELDDFAETSVSEFFLEYYLQLFDNPSYEITYDGGAYAVDYYYNPKTEEYAEESQHEYEYEYKVNGETCKDGCTVVTTCKHCDYYDEYTRHWCDTEWNKIDLSDYDCCDGWIYYTYCSVCGNYDYIHYDIHGYYDYDEEAITDEDGNEIGIRSTYIFDDCVLTVIEKQLKVYDTTCEGTTYRDVSISIGETSIFEGSVISTFEDHDYEVTDVIFDVDGGTCEDGYTATYVCTKCGDSYEERGFWHNYEYVEIDLADYDCCGGYIYYDYCPVCGTVDDIHSSLKCDYKYTYEAILDDDGNEIGWTYTYTCTECNIKIIESSWREYYSACEGTRYESVVVYVGEECILEYLNSSTFEEHKYQYTYTPLGNDCDEDGYMVIETCSKCGEVLDSYEGYGHRYAYDEIYLAEEYGCCDGYIYYNYCPVCNTVHDIECDFGWHEGHDWDGKEILDDDENEIGWTDTYTCPTCGLKVIESSWREYYSACEGTYYNEVVVYVGEECIFENLSASTFTEHTYEYTYEPLGETCDDGYMVTVTCSKCGDVIESYKGHGHRLETNHIYLGEYGLCGGWIYQYYCTVCNQVFDSYGYDNCNWKFVTTTEDGAKVYECRECGAIKHCSQTKVKDEYCNCTTTETIVYYMDDEEVARYVETRIDIEHDYKISVEFDGETCDDGYTITFDCPDCGDSYSERGSGHRTEGIYTDLSELGLCGGEICEDYCIVCKQLISSSCYDNCDWKLVETTDDGIEIYTCQVCGSVKRYSYVESEKDDNCQYTATETIVYYNADGKELYKCEYTDTLTNHDFETSYEVNNGGICTEDGCVVTRICTDCGYKTSWVLYFCQRDYKEIDLSNYACCDGYINYGYCLGCDTYYNINWQINCDYEFETKEICDDEKNVIGWMCTYTCNNCDLKLIESEWRVYDSVCEGTLFTKIVAYVGDECIFDGTVSSSFEEHNYQESSIKLDGKTCDEGYTITFTCSKCGDSYDEEHWGHRYETNYIELSEYGLCGGWINEKYCSICDEVLDSYGDDYCIWEWSDENEEYTEYRCLECGSIKRTYTTERKLEDGCIYGIVDTIVYCNSDGDELCRYDDFYSIRNQETRHNYETTVEFDGKTCDDGYTITRTCLDCGYTERDWGCGHQCEHVDKDLSEYGLCGGTVHTEYCTICNQVLDSYYSENCIWELVEETEDGAIYQCWRCKTKKYYSVSVGELQDDDCYRNITETIVYYNADGEEVYGFENTERKYHNYEYTYKLNGETCEDGYTVIYTCLDCGETDSYQNTNHLTERNVINLSEKGLCDGRIYEDYCIVCKQSIGALFETTCEWELQEPTEDGYTVYECAICHAQKYYKVTEETIVCQFIKTTTTVLYNADGDEVYTDVYSNTWEQHNYEYTYVLEDEKTCEDGYMVIYACTNCDVSWKWQELSHILNGDDEYIDFNQHGICEGWIHNEYCTLCKQLVISYCNDSCDWAFVDTTEDGIEVYECQTCGAVKRCTQTKVKDEYCNCTIKETTVYYMDDKEVARYVKTYTEFEHDYKTSVVFYGEDNNCDDGYTITYTCTDCGYTYTDWDCTHRYEKLDIELAEYGLCNGEIYSEYCSICNYVRSSYCNDSCDWAFVETTADGIEVYECRECGAIKHCTYTENVESVNCQYTVTTVYYNKAGEEVGIYEYFTAVFSFDKVELVADNDTPYAVFSGTYVPRNTSEEAFKAKFLEIAQDDCGFNLQQYNTWKQLFYSDDFIDGVPDIITIIYNEDGTFQIKVDIGSLNADNGWYISIYGGTYIATEWTIGQSITVDGITYTLDTGENSGTGWGNILTTIWVTDATE